MPDPDVQSSLQVQRTVMKHGDDTAKAQLRAWIRRDAMLVDLLRAGVGIGGGHWTDAPGRWAWEQRVLGVIGSE